MVGLPIGKKFFMKDVYELLRQKEAAIERVRKEICALQLVAPLLADDATGRVGDSTMAILRGLSPGLTRQT